MLDTNALSFGDERFAYPRKGVSHRHVVDAFATIAWFRGLACRASASTVAEVMRFCGHDRFSSDAHRQMRHRQWAQRAIGRHTPNPLTVSQVEARQPGSSAVLQLALWPALRSDWPVEQSIEEVLRRLPAGHRDMLEAALRNDRGYAVPLERRRRKWAGTLDDLACLLVCCRLANEAKDGSAGYHLSDRINCVLLLQAGWLMEHGLVHPLVGYIDRHFYQAVPAPYAGIVSTATYFRMLRWLTVEIPRQNPEMSSSFCAETWSRVAVIALQQFGDASFLQAPQQVGQATRGMRSGAIERGCRLGSASCRLSIAQLDELDHE